MLSLCFKGLTCGIMGAKQGHHVCRWFQQADFYLSHYQHRNDLILKPNPELKKVRSFPGFILSKAFLWGTSFLLFIHSLVFSKVRCMSSLIQQDNQLPISISASCRMMILSGSSHTYFKV